jgi:hypothetical protein
VAIPPTSGSAPAPAALSDGDQISIVERCESDPTLVALVREDSEVSAGRKGKQAQYYCAACGYGIVVYGRPPGCPMCSEGRGSMLSGGLPPSCSTTLPVPLAPEASDVACTRLPRQRTRSRSATFARVKPAHRSKNDVEGGT